MSLEITTTRTTEYTEVLGETLKVTIFEQSVSAYCDICGSQQSGSQSSLENRGWYLGRREQFCPNCNV